MPQTETALDRPTRVRLELETNFLRVQSPAAALIVWERVLAGSERAKLGGDLEEAWRKGGTVGMWMRLRGCSQVRAIIDLARRIEVISEETQRWLLRATGEFSDDPDEALEMALKRADLVLTESPRAVYWLGQSIDIDWNRHSALWDYFITLCTKAKAGQDIDASDFGMRRKRDNHTKQKSRLTNLPDFPLDLADRIIAENGGRQRLDIPRDQVCILQIESEEVVRERI